jgi:hypothetical protein
MKRHELLTGLAAAALASGCTSQAPGRAHTSQAHYGSPVPLPPPATTDTISLEKAIGKRRSLRAFRPGPLHRVRQRNYPRTPARTAVGS